MDTCNITSNEHPASTTTIAAQERRRRRRQWVLPLTETKSMLCAANSSYLAAPISAIYPASLPFLRSTLHATTISLRSVNSSTSDRCPLACQTCGNNLRSRTIYSHISTEALHGWCSWHINGTQCPSSALCAAAKRVACVRSLISPCQSAFTQFAASPLLIGPAIWRHS